HDGHAGSRARARARYGVHLDRRGGQSRGGPRRQHQGDRHGEDFGRTGDRYGRSENLDRSGGGDMIRDILRMGDPRLLDRSKPVDSFGTAELDLLLADMRETMTAANGAGLAAPQIGVGPRGGVLGFDRHVRYPGAEP